MATVSWLSLIIELLCEMSLVARFVAHCPIRLSVSTPTKFCRRSLRASSAPTSYCFLEADVRQTRRSLLVAEVAVSQLRRLTQLVGRQSAM